MGRYATIEMDTEIDVNVGVDTAISCLVECEPLEDRGFFVCFDHGSSFWLDAHLCSPGTRRRPAGSCTLLLSSHLLFSVSLLYGSSRSLKAGGDTSDFTASWFFPPVINYMHVKHRCVRNIAEDLKSRSKGRSAVPLVTVSPHLMSLHKCHLRSEAFLDVPFKTSD